MAVERYEFTEGTSNKFWEIALAGKEFTARWGRIGASSRNEKRQAFPDVAAARKAYQRLIDEKTKKGYRRVGAEAKQTAKTAAKPSKTAVKPTKINPKLEAVLAEAPEDVGSWQVYADWAMESGEPWGEVIAHACAGKKPKKLQDEAAATMLGGLDGAVVKWKFGTLEELELCPEDRDREDDGSGDNPMVAALKRVLAHPAGRLIRKLTLGLSPFDDCDWDFEPLLKVIGKAGSLPLLHTLDLSRDAEFMDQDSWRHLGDLRPLWRVAPRLRYLKIKASAKPCTLGAVVAPVLETLVFESSGLDKSVPIDIGKAELPALRHLELMFGREDYGNTGSVKNLAGILAGSGLPKLEYLGLANSEWETDLIEAVAKSAVLPRLKVLDLSKGTLHAEGSAALLAHAPQFRHLDKLDLEDNYLLPEHTKALRKAIPHASLSNQREIDDYDGDVGYRYCSIGE